jgi:hypothetical protein
MRKLIGLLGATALAASLLVGTASASANPTSAAPQAATKSKMSLKASAQSFVHGKDGVVLTATVKAAGKNASGKVSFTDGKKKLKTVALKKGKAQYRLPSSLAVGTHSIKATYVPKSKTVKAVAKKASIQVFSLSLKIDQNAYTVYVDNYVPINYAAEYSGTPGTTSWLDFWYGSYRPNSTVGDKMADLKNQGDAKKFVSNGTYWWSPAGQDPGTVALQVSFTPTVSAKDATAIADFTMTTLSNVLAVGADIAPGTYRLAAGPYADACTWRVTTVDGNTTYGRENDLMPVNPTDTQVTFYGCSGGPVPA